MSDNDMILWPWLHNGDSSKVLRALPSGLAHAMVCDPPAGIANGLCEDWDHDQGGRDEWVRWLSKILRQSLRVCRPGAHALVWAMPRTAHWTMYALEDAGWEIRDVIVHLCGTSFPQGNNDVGHSVDRTQGAVRDVVGATQIVGAQLHKLAAHDNSQWSGIKRGGPVTPEGERWDGWHTRLKPAAEHWILARAPLADGTVARNVLSHDVGAINVDGCRVPPNGTPLAAPRSDPANRQGVVGSDLGISNQDADTFQAAQAASVERTNALGRWPSNVVLSHAEGCSSELCAEDCPVAMLDAQSGVTRTVAGPAGQHPRPSALFHWAGNVSPNNQHADTGGASRFFTRFKYAPKATGADACREYNTHPTTKHTSLMEWLVELVTRPGHVVLDPFMGSGTTGVACARLGRRFVGVELDPEHYETARRRLVDQGETERTPRPSSRQGAKPPVAKRRRTVLGKRKSGGVL